MVAEVSFGWIFVVPQSEQNATGKILGATVIPEKLNASAQGDEQEEWAVIIFCERKKEQSLSRALPAREKDCFPDCPNHDLRIGISD